jgi:hypothetical protein
MMLVLLALLKTQAQPVWLETDSLTYRYYLDQDWKRVLHESKQSLGKGVDFYYLRTRAGKAAYELKKYRLAASHFAMAHAWNPSDEFVNYWYYWSLVMAARTDEANELASSFAPEYLERMQIAPRGKLHAVLLESQLTLNREHNKLVAERIVADGSYINYRNTMKQQFYTGAGIDHAVNSKINLFHALSHLGIERTERFESDYPQLDHTEEPTTSQFTYYLQGRYLIGNGWGATASVSLQWGTANSHWNTYRNSPVPIVTPYQYRIGDQIASLGIAKDFWWIQPRLSVSAGSINQWRQIQVNPQVTIYPFGNNNFYSVSGLTLNNDQSADKTKYVFNQKIGIKTGPVWWIADGWLGPMKNFSASDGYVVYNIPEEIKQTASLAIYLPLFQHKLELMARYLVAQKEGYTYHYSNTTDYTTSTYQFTYNNFLISLKWNF